MSAGSAAGPVGGLAGYFKFAERGTNLATEARGGLTTFVVMAYIIFVNAAILGAGFKLDPAGIAAVSAGTALVAGIMTIAMGVVGNYPLAMAAGLGINGIVAFSLTAKGVSPQGAMGVIVIEGVIVTLLVLAGFREAVMRAVPVSLRRAIGVGIGLFILFIGFVGGGFIATPAGGVPIVGPVYPTELSQFVFLFGLLLTIGLWVLKIRAALIISIAVITIVSLVLGVAKVPPNLSATPSFATLGQFNLTDAFSVLGPVTAVLTIFAIMLTDFFDTMGTVTGVASEAGLADEDGNVPNVGPVLLVDSIGAAVGGLAGVSSNTTYIESAAGVADGARTGFASVVTGVLFLFAIFLAPLAGIIPPVATVAGPRPRRLPDVHPGPRDRRLRPGRGHPGAADDDPHAPDLRDHRRHRRRLHLVDPHQGHPGQGERGPLAHVAGVGPVRHLLPAGLAAAGPLPGRHHLGIPRHHRRRSPPPLELEAVRHPPGGLNRVTS